MTSKRCVGYIKIIEPRYEPNNLRPLRKPLKLPRSLMIAWSFAKTSWEDKSQNSYAKGGKRNFSQSPADLPQNPKGGHQKPKGGRGPLTHEDFERAKNERL